MAAALEKARSYKRAAKPLTKTRRLRTGFSTPPTQEKHSPKARAETRRETILRRSKSTKYWTTRMVTTSAFKNNRLHLQVKSEKDRARCQYVKPKPRNGSSHQSIWRMSWWCRRTISIWLIAETKQTWRAWASASSVTTSASESQDRRRNWSQRRSRWWRRLSLGSLIAKTIVCHTSTPGLQVIPIIKRTFGKRRNPKLTPVKSLIGRKICTFQRCSALLISKLQI